MFASISLISVFEFVYCITMKVKSRLVKIKKRSRIDIAEADYVSKFTTLSSVREVNLIFAKNQKPIVKIFWTLIVLIPTAACLFLILDTVDRSKPSLVMFDVDEKVWSLNDVSFLV